MHGAQKTIFITSFYGLIGRNLLATDILPTLFQEAPEAKVVIVLPQEKEESYRKLFGSERVVVQGVPGEPESGREKFMAKLFFYLCPTESARISYRSLGVNKKYIRMGILWCVTALGNVKIIRKLARQFEYLTMPKNSYAEYFEKYQPTAVFATDMFRHQDVDVLREARARGIRTVGMVRSWDNLSTKGLNRIVPDHVVVQAEKMREDIIRLGDVRPEQISIVGVPHYDGYGKGSKLSREAFFRSMDLDPKKKTLLLSPPLRHYAGDPIAEVIFNAVKDIPDLQVIIRMTLVGKSNIGGLKPIPGKLAIDAPSTAEDFNQADITTGDSHLIDLLQYSDAVAAHISTIVIDGIVFDKPGFFVGFNTKPMPYHKSVRWYFDMDCGRDLITTGAVRLSETVEEFVAQLKAHLADPKLGAKERQLVRERYCYKLDGHSGERLGKVLAEQLSIS